MALLSALGCNDVTMELLPKPPAQSAGRAGDTSEQAGEAAVGSGGTTAGQGGSGSGLGGFGNTGNASFGGEGNQAAFGGCGPTGCFPEIGCAPLELDCKLCKDDRDCDGEKPYCEPYIHHCVACRTPQECPLDESCENDCPASAARCDPATNTCREACFDREGPHFEVCSPFEFCDRVRSVCVECNGNDDCKYSSKGSVCYQRLQVCVECYVDKFDGYSPGCRDPSRPICHVDDLACHPCEDAEECGGSPWRCEDGRCVGSPPQP